MTSYKINYEQLRQHPEISEMLSALEKGFKKFGIDFYLVGAVARDASMNGINKIAPRRTTGDLDFAILINNKGVYEQLKEYLISRSTLLEIIEDRHEKGSTIITSQLPVNKWHEVIGEQTIADAILDRLVHDSHRIEMKGESLRKKNGPKTEEFIDLNNLKN